ncbi:MAG: anhydro-N-acetylmuramic acid kinase [Brumimicrobium sp.]|nr:anhydro-N-acetylmuramic acid kinase [Brumimicrobium sp.]
MGKYHVIGLMSGTSLDGVDVVEVEFFLNDKDRWEFKVLNCHLFPYNKMTYLELKEAYTYKTPEILELSSKLGKYYGEIVNDFIDQYSIDKNTIDFIASHGQTIFHQPDKGYTLQIGNGPELAVTTNLPTVVDFRTKDVALGGNGAPLIPVADFLLFKQYADTFLNLGGFSNFSFLKENQVYSYDICPVNIVINKIMQEQGKEYDNRGNFGKTGIINQELLQKLNRLNYYQQSFPKSLGWEWVEEHILPLLSLEPNIQNQVRTLYEHFANQIGKSLDDTHAKTTLVTGGGAKNNFLIERIQSNTKSKIILPDSRIIDFKEAIGFAFLGLLRWRNETNVWASVTGARRDSCSGNIVIP